MNHHHNHTIKISSQGRKNSKNLHRPGHVGIRNQEVLLQAFHAPAHVGGKIPDDSADHLPAGVVTVAGKDALVPSF